MIKKDHQHDGASGASPGATDERTLVEGQLAELRYTAQMCVSQSLPLPDGSEAELRRLEARLSELKVPS